MIILERLTRIFDAIDQRFDAMDQRLDSIFRLESGFPTTTDDHDDGGYNDAGCDNNGTPYDEYE